MTADRTIGRLRTLRESHWAVERSDLLTLFGLSSVNSLRFLDALIQLSGAKYKDVEFGDAVACISEAQEKRINSGGSRGLSRDRLWAPADVHEAIAHIDTILASNESLTSNSLKRKRSTTDDASAAHHRVILSVQRSRQGTKSLTRNRSPSLSSSEQHHPRKGEQSEGDKQSTVDSASQPRTNGEQEQITEEEQETEKGYSQVVSQKHRQIRRRPVAIKRVAPQPGGQTSRVDGESLANKDDFEADPEERSLEISRNHQGQRLSDISEEGESRTFYIDEEVETGTIAGLQTSLSTNNDLDAGSIGVMEEDFPDLALVQQKADSAHPNSGNIWPPHPRDNLSAQKLGASMTLGDRFTELDRQIVDIGRHTRTALESLRLPYAKAEEDFDLICTTLEDVSGNIEEHQAEEAELVARLDTAESDRNGVLSIHDQAVKAFGEGTLMRTNFMDYFAKEITRLEAQRNEAEEKLRLIREDIRTKQAESSRLIADKERLQAELGEARHAYEDQRDQLKERARAMIMVWQTTMDGAFGDGTALKMMAMAKE